MTELIRVDFRKRFVKSRETLDGAPQPYNPYQDEFFKAYTKLMADLCVEADKEGGDAQRLITLIDSHRGGDGMAVLFDQEIVPRHEVIQALEAALVRLKEPSVEPA